MYECWECWEVYKGRKEGRKIKIFDEVESRWVSECPSCGCDDFVEFTDEDS